MTDREKAIRYFQQSVDSAPIVRLSAIKEHVDACETALAALRAEGEREKGCGYCTGENPPPIVENSETCIFYNRRANEFYDGAYPLDWTACPVCGRKLDGGGQDGR